MWAGVLHELVAISTVVLLLSLIFTVEKKARTSLLIGIAALAISAGGLFLRSLANDPVPDEGSFTIEATVTGDLAIKSGRTIGQVFREGSGSLPVRITAVTQEGHRLRLRSPARLLTTSTFPEFTPGTQIALGVRAIPRIDDQVLLKAITPPVIRKPAGPVAHMAQGIRQGLRKAAEHLPRSFGGLLPGLVDGDTRLLAEELNQEMRETNLTHLTAVSGANLALVVAFVITIIRWLRIPRRFQPYVSSIAVAGFVLIARPDPSVMRAAVMAGVLILANAFEIPALGLTSLTAAVIILILLDPSQGQKPGFVLSVLATAGILIFGLPWTHWLMRWMPRWLAQSLATPMAAQALCTPYLVVISGQLSLIGVWTNLLVSPVIAPATILGFITGLVSPFSHGVAAVIAWLSSPSLWWISFVARSGSRLSFANIFWFAGWLGAFAAILLIASLILWGRRSPKTLMVSYLLLLVVVALFRAVTPGWPMRSWSLVMCDVGQGDGLVVRASDTSAVVIDAGPEPRAMDRCLKNLGIRDVPLLILTHNHADHVEGLRGVINGRKVGAIWVSPEMEPVFESRRVEQWSKGIPVLHVPLHQHFQTALIDLEAVWPSDRISEGSIPNNSSIVLRIKTHSRDVLLMGDVEQEAQERLMSEVVGPIDVLKVAHHGSANQSVALLERLSPRIALVSVGRINPYGHPSASTLSRLKRQGAALFRTDRDGAVAVELDTREIKVLRQGHPWWRQL